MSIAGIVLAAPEACLAGLEAALKQREDILEARRTPPDARIQGLAVVLERPSDRLQTALRELRDLPGVQTLSLAFADYEDDLDAQGCMDCPEKTPRETA